MKKVVATTNAPGAIGPYSQAIIAGDILCYGDQGFVATLQFPQA